MEKKQWAIFFSVFAGTLVVIGLIIYSVYGHSFKNNIRTDCAIQNVRPK